MDGDKNILKFQKYMKNVELGKYFLFSNYIIKNNIFLFFRARFIFF